jgi:hypothetical protein
MKVDNPGNSWSVAEIRRDSKGSRFSSALARFKSMHIRKLIAIGMSATLAVTSLAGCGVGGMAFGFGQGRAVSQNNAPVEGMDSASTGGSDTAADGNGVAAGTEASAGTSGTGTTAAGQDEARQIV